MKQFITEEVRHEYKIIWYFIRINKTVNIDKV